MRRTGTGASLSPYGLANKYAANSSERKAVSNLDDKLYSDCDVVPCAHCLKFQANMVVKAKKMRREGYGCLGWPLMVVGGVLAWVFFGSPPDTISPLFKWVGLPIFAAGAVSVIAGFVIAAFYDPNAMPIDTRRAMADSRSFTYDPSENSDPVPIHPSTAEIRRAAPEDERLKESVDGSFADGGSR